MAFPFPAIEVSVEEEVAALVQASFQVHNDAARLLEDAKTHVEALVLAA